MYSWSGCKLSSVFVFSGRSLWSWKRCLRWVHLWLLFLYSLSWKLRCITPMHYLSIFFMDPIVSRLVPSTILKSQIHDKRCVDYLRLFAFFFSDVALGHYKYRQYGPSLLAVACFVCAKHALQIKYCFCHLLILDPIGMIRIRTWCRRQVRMHGQFMMSCGRITLDFIRNVRHRSRLWHLRIRGMSEMYSNTLLFLFVPENDQNLVLALSREQQRKQEW